MVRLASTACANTQRSSYLKIAFILFSFYPFIPVIYLVSEGVTIFPQKSRVGILPQGMHGLADYMVRLASTAGANTQTCSYLKIAYTFILLSFYP